jgi:truncated hemoglobin YjbI
MLRLIAVPALLALLGGCATMRIAYNNAEPLVRYTAHDYFDLDERQNEQFRMRLLQFHDWHRASELPLYAGLLRTAAQRGGKGITREDVAWAAAEIRSRYSVVMIKAVNDAAPILASLSPAQITELEKRLVKGNEKFARDFLPADEDKRFRAQAKRLVGRFKDWTGTLSDGQEDRIERFVKAHLNTTQMRFENRKRWQKEAVGLIRQTRTPGELAPRLADIFVNPGDHRLPEYVRALVRWESDLTDTILDIDRTLTPEQRAHVLQRMQRYVDDFEALAAQGSVAATAEAPGMR